MKRGLIKRGSQLRGKTIEEVVMPVLEKAGDEKLVLTAKKLYQALEVYIKERYG